MSVSAISAGGIYATSQQPVQSLSYNKQASHRPTSLSDIDAQSSSLATAPSLTGKVGSKVNLTV
jgi:hypothetical protein